MSNTILRKQTILTGGPGSRGVPISVAAPLLLDAYPSAAFAYSFRKLRAAYAGSAVRLRDTTNNNEQDFGFVGNDFDAASVVTFLGGHSAAVATWYDQSGNSADVTSPFATAQPAYSATGLGSKPTISVVSSPEKVLRSVVDSVPFSGAIFSAAAVAVRTGGANTRLLAWIANGQNNDFFAPSGVLFRVNGSNNIDGARNGGLSQVTATSGVAYGLASIFDSANHTMYKAGVAGTPVASAGGNFTGPGQVEVFDSSQNEPWDGLCSELIGWASNQASNVSAIYANHSAYYGV